MFSLFDKRDELRIDLDISFRKNWCHEIKTIDRLSGETYEYFLRNHMISNKPCIFTSDLTDNWVSRNKWLKADGKPDLDFLIQEFGSSVVPVVICDDREDFCERKEMLFKAYIKEYFNTEVKMGDKMYYLKDWHFNRAYPNYKAYVTPFYFCDDWLNEFCENEDDDFKFVYMGPKGTWTPLHADVYGSYSWSANICGRKRWLLFPPGEENSLQKNSKIPFMLKETDIMNLKNVSFFDVIQEPGEVIFVPSGWYHQVWNLILLKAHHGMNLFKFLDILESRVALAKCQKETTTHQEDMQVLKNVCEKMLSCSLPDGLSNNISVLIDDISKFFTNL
ncbi:2-oxoglutarate and iron-dependent oxygenase JMJD4 isoform X2 [Parasteatoda tepidariorum]|uniref:2-oxoglutarate and iron-dependent oxygenase JMJD4 isoform X2 n=1 Tax=Parasteatoda tepidariorum TaxID=114398 RepID=UPI001C72454B|nr:2-oxoglutarate and iron-dependent oxygenase JMJD4 isoform X2 [Parasteatoda tepidariorum]